MSKTLTLGIGLATLVAMTGCSVKRFAINTLGDSLANSGTTSSSFSRLVCS